jgi:hypothetical protein
MNVRHLALAAAALFASSSWALTDTDGGAVYGTLGVFTEGWQGFADRFGGYDSTPKMIPLQTVECTVGPDGRCTTDAFPVVGSYENRALAATDLINGYSFGGGVVHVDRSSDNGIWQVVPEPVLDPAQMEKREACLKYCADNRKAAEDHNAIQYAKLKAKYKTGTYTSALFGALVGVAAPGVAKIPGLVIGGGGAYLIAKEYTGDLLEAFDLAAKATVIKNYYDCRKNICKVG